MATSVTDGLPAEQDPASARRADAGTQGDGAGGDRDDLPEPATATASSASPLAGTERVQTLPDTDIPPSAVGRIPILAVAPVVDGARFRAKAVVGEPVPVSATVIREGHDAVAATAVLVDPDGVDHTRARMQ